MTPVPPAANLTLELAGQILAAQPFSVLLGARVTSFGEGEATLEIDIRDELRQQNGYLHGGVLAYAADNTLTFAGGSALGPAVLTGGFTIDYLRPAQGRTLQAHARVIYASRRQATCRCDLYVLDAEGTATHCAARARNRHLHPIRIVSPNRWPGSSVAWLGGAQFGAWHVQQARYLPAGCPPRRLIPRELG